MNFKNSHTKQTKAKDMFVKTVHVLALSSTFKTKRRIEKVSKIVLHADKKNNKKSIHVKQCNKNIVITNISHKCNAWFICAEKIHS
jgi:hypothetical protein